MNNKLKVYSNNKSTSYERLSVDVLKIADYQLPRLQIARAKSIAKDFNSHKLGVLTVSFRDGHYFVVDGQHRLVAAKMVGFKDLMCMILEGLTYEDEALLFATQDDKVKNVMINHKFSALIEAKNPTALKIKSIVESAGLELSFRGYKSNNQIIAIATIQTIFKQYGEFGLYKVCKLIKDTWNGKPLSLDKNIINGVYFFIKTYETDMDDKMFVKKLTEVEPLVIIREGKSDITYKGGSIRFAKVVWKYYNHGLRNKLPNKF